MLYKFPQLSRQEIAAMLGVEALKQTRFYQEVFAEGKQEGIQQGKQEGIQQGKLEAVSRMLASGVDVETIAQWLDLPLDVVREKANNPRSRFPSQFCIALPSTPLLSEIIRPHRPNQVPLTKGDSGGSLRDRAFLPNIHRAVVGFTVRRS